VEVTARACLVIAAAGLNVPEQRLAERHKGGLIANDGVVRRRRGRGGKQSRQWPDRPGVIAAAAATATTAATSTAALRNAAAAGTTSAAAAAATGATATGTTSATASALGEIATAAATGTATTSTAAARTAATLGDTSTILGVSHDRADRHKPKAQTKDGDDSRHVATKAIPFHGHSPSDDPQYQAALDRPGLVEARISLGRHLIDNGRQPMSAMQRFGLPRSGASVYFVIRQLYSAKIFISLGEYYRLSNDWSSSD
jgi:hypothetical protein